MTLVIGITGGMASGKSTAARMAKQPGILLFNADDAVHYLFNKNRACIAAIAAHFPAVDKKGVIDRAALSAAITKDAAALLTLENIVHPFVRQMENQLINKAVRHRLRAVILDIPLLFETGAEALCDYVIAVDVAPDLQRRRAFLRRGMTEAKYQKLLARQISGDTRNQLADAVITSNLGRAAMRRQIGRIMKRLGAW